jgi:GNAT superfamily N-acetyltransferase
LALDLRGILHQGLKAPLPLWKYRPGPQRHEVRGGVVLMANDEDKEGMFSSAIVFEPLTPEQFFATFGAFFHPGQAFSVTVEDGEAPEFEEALRQHGWQLDEEEPALVLAPIPAAIPPAPAELEISLVRDEQGLADFRSITRMPPQIVPSLAAATDPAVALLVGRVAGAPVTTGRLSTLGMVADITSITTVPAARRRGYGTAITWAVIAEAARRGCTSAMLTATEMGYPVYVRMGFQLVTSYRTYILPDTQAEG